MERTPSEPDAGGPDKEPGPEPPVVDDGRFGIDLGPAGDRPKPPDPDETPSAAPVKPPARTLTERLATAAADRDDAGTTIDENHPSTE